MTQVDNPITEEWKGISGYENYYSIPLIQGAQLRNQHHVNVRSFYGDANTVSVAARDVYMLFMDTLTMSALSAVQMTALDAEVTVREGELWTQGTWTRDASRKNWNTLSVSCIANVPTSTVSTLIE